MPNSKTHDIASSFTTPIVGFIFYIIINDVKLTVLFILSFLFSSFMFNGDLDTISKPYLRWGVFRFIWWPYRKLFSHRSVFTHGVLIGTAIRVLWLLPLIVTIFSFLSVGFSDIGYVYYLIVFVGLELGCFLHLVLDKAF
jgi:uncharacterized metal-binding protein